MAGKIANRYQIRRLIGQGGMADVYLAYDEVLGREVAIKVLHQKLAEDPATLVRFIREASAARRLDHPNVVEIYDVGESSSLHYIVMEYVPGQTLKKVIAANGPMDADVAIAIMKKLTSAIAQAHERKIIHRDIKPQNILVRNDGELKISDFGIAIASDYDMDSSGSAIMGSAHYLAPETAAGMTPDHRVDIYSLGIVFFELLCGSVPFTGTTAPAIALKHLQDPLPPVQPFNAPGTPATELVVIKATAKDPSERFQTAGQLLKALEQCRQPRFRNVAPLVLKTKSLELPKAQTVQNTAIKTKEAPKPAVRKKGAAPSRPKKNPAKQTAVHHGSRSAAPGRKSAGYLAARKEQMIKKVLGWSAGLIGGALVIALIVMGFGIAPVDGWFGWNEVPVVEGMSQEQAIAALNEAGIPTGSIEIRPIASDSFEPGQAQSTSIPAGCFVHDGDRITLTIVKGPTYLISDYTGLYLDDVLALFNENGVTIPYTVTEQPTAGTNPGIVLSQEGLSPGDRIDPTGESAIHFTITAYPSITIDSSLIGRNAEDLKAELNEKGIAVILKPIYGSDKVVDIDPPIGSVYTQEGSNSVVTLYH